jgi:ankyrin repeat protein
MIGSIFSGNITNLIQSITGGPSNEFFLAIERNKNDKVEELLLTYGKDVARVLDGGIAAIHVACRHNNIIALQTILSFG